MIKYFIEINKGVWLTDPEEKAGHLTTDPNKAMSFDARGEAWRWIEFFIEEDLMTGAMVTEHRFIEIENVHEDVWLGTLTIGDRMTVKGIPVREYDIELLRGGEGC